MKIEYSYTSKVKRLHYYNIFETCLIKMVNRFKEQCYISISMKLLIILLNILSKSSCTIPSPSVAECAKPGIRMGAGLGAVAGGTAGAALLTHLGIGSITYAACPTLALTTIAGAGTGVLAGPLLPVGKLYLSSNTFLYETKL